MKLWVLEDENWDYDQFDGHAVLANTETEARDAAFMASGKIEYGYDSREAKWLDPTKTTIRRVKTNPSEPLVVLSSFRAG